MRKDLLLGSAISDQARVPVQMILAQIQNRRSMRGQRRRKFELKARQFKDPDSRWRSGTPAFEPYLKGRGTDVSGQCNLSPSRRQQMCKETRRGRFPIGSGNRDHAWRLRILRDRATKQFNLAHHRNRPLAHQSRQRSRRSEIGRKTRAPGQAIESVQPVAVSELKRTATEPRLRVLTLPLSQARGRYTAIANSDLSPLIGQPARHRQA